MEKFYAAVVNDEHGQRVFYVGEPDVEAATQTLLRAQPDLEGSNITFYEQPGSISGPLGISKGQVMQWVVGTHVRLTTGWTGTVVG
jgi:hypothetical protein